MYTITYCVLRSGYKSEIPAITNSYQVLDFFVIPQYHITKWQLWRFLLLNTRIMSIKNRVISFL